MHNTHTYTLICVDEFGIPTWAEHAPGHFPATRAIVNAISIKHTYIVLSNSGCCATTLDPPFEWTQIFIQIRILRRLKLHISQVFQALLIHIDSGIINSNNFSLRTLVPFR